MRRTSLLGVLIALAGCELGAPAWIRQPTSATASSISAVGSAGGPGAPVMDVALRRKAAEGNARGMLFGFVQRRLGSGAESGRMLSFVQDELIGSEIADHWVAGDGTEYALAVLTRSSLETALAARTDLTDEQRRSTSARLGALFEP